MVHICFIFSSLRFYFAFVSISYFCYSPPHLSDFRFYVFSIVLPSSGFPDVYYTIVHHLLTFVRNNHLLSFFPFTYLFLFLVFNPYFLFLVSLNFFYFAVLLSFIFFHFLYIWFLSFLIFLSACIFISLFL